MARIELLKQGFHYLRKSFNGGYLMGIFIAFTALSTGRYLNETAFAQFFFPKNFEIPRINSMAFHVYYVLFGGLVLGGVVLCLGLVSLLGSHVMKLDRLAAKRTIYICAVLAFSTLAMYSGLFTVAQHFPRLEAMIMSGLAAALELVLTIIFITILLRLCRRGGGSDYRLHHVFLASIFIIQVRSFGVISSSTNTEYSQNMYDYFVFPLILTAISFLACILLLTVCNYGVKARELRKGNLALFSVRSAATVFNSLFLFLLILSVLMISLLGNRPVEEKIWPLKKRSESNDLAVPNGFNVVILLIDALRRDHLGCYGYHESTSPFLDEMAQEGIKFNNAFAVSSWTLPTVSTIFTGYYPTIHGATGPEHVVSPSLTTMAEAFKRKGYATAAFTTIPYLKKIYNLHQGFDWYDDDLLKKTFLGLAIENTSYLQILPRVMYYTRILLNLPVQDPAVVEFTSWWSTKLNARNVNERVLKWLRKEREAPFFLYVHYLDVHSPHFDPHPYKDDPTWEKLRYDPMHDVDDRINLYDGGIRYADEQIRNLVKSMKELNMYENSLIIFLSDHGEEFLDHGGVGHGISLYGEQLNIPMIIFPTAVVPGNLVIDAPVSQIDLFPTLDDWLSLGAPYHGSGLSLRELILSSYDSCVNTRRLLFAEMDYQIPLRSVLSENRWKYILNMESKKAEIYDLTMDQTERNDLSISQDVLSMSLKQNLIDHFVELRKSAASPEQIRLDDWTKQSLKALGYLD